MQNQERHEGADGRRKVVDRCMFEREAAKEEAEKLAKRLEELERKLGEEIKRRDRAEKNLECAIKRLESLKVSDIALSPVSSSSSQCFLGQQRSGRDMSGSVTADLGHGGEGVKTILSSSGDDAPGTWARRIESPAGVSERDMDFIRDCQISIQRL